MISELTEILKTSDDPDELAYYWKEWYDKAGTSAHSLYKEYLQLKNEDALRNYGKHFDGTQFGMEFSRLKFTFQVLIRWLMCGREDIRRSLRKIWKR